MKDLWEAYLGMRVFSSLKASLLIIVQNNELQIEGMVRSLVQEINENPVWCEIVIVEYASSDITPYILMRLAEQYGNIKVICLPEGERPLLEGVRHCAGDVICIMDLINRMKQSDFSEVLERIVSR